MKKTIIILIIILLIIGMTVGIYFYWKAKKNVVVTPPVKEGLIAEKIMQYPQFTSDKKWIYYYSTAEEPAFYRLELSSQKIEKISDDLADIDNIIYSPDLSHAAFKVTYDHDRFEKYASPFLDPKMQDGQTRYWIVNFKNKTLNYLNENIVNLNFTNDSQKIIYLYRALAGDSSLNLANTDGSNYETIIDWQSESVVFEAFDDNNFLMVSLAD